MSLAALDDRVADLLRQMTLVEKVRLLAGASSFTLHPIERLGLPALRMTDGPTGVRSIDGVPATVFPVGVAIAATWNPDTAGQVAAAIAREAHALGDHVVLAPTINIMRIPTWGRNFETYSEDPYLAGVMGSAYVRGLQGEGIGASLKHFAANNQELERFRVDARVDERTLREIYLAAFERVVREADPWTVMASYNKLNGTYASEHRRLLTDILKDEWGYAGMVVSDWAAVHSTVDAPNAGLDLEMPGPARWFGDKLLAAVEAGDVPLAQIDDNARRVVRLIVRAGLMDAGPRPGGELRTARHQAIAFDAACEAMTLLKNDGGLLPLSPKLKTVALIGPNAARCLLQGGGSSQVVTDRVKTPAEGLRDLLGPEVTVIEARGVDNDPFPPTPAAWRLSPTRARDAEGLQVDYFASPDGSGAAHATALERTPIAWGAPQIASGDRPAYASLRWSGWFWPEESGVHEFGVRATGAPRFSLDGAPLITTDTSAAEDHFDVIGRRVPRRLASAPLEAGRGYRLQVDYTPRAKGYEYLSLGIRPPRPDAAVAIEAARAADAVILVLGSGLVTEAEGYDRADMALPGGQDDLARAVLAANSSTVVVMNTGSPFALPWIDQARAVLQMWLPGETGPDALAAVLFGAQEPGGRLPISYPRAFGDHPAHATGPDPLVCDYAEGLAVGYRDFDQTGVAPLFPFGHGLGYTTFTLSDLAAPATGVAGQAVTVEVCVTNTGAGTGSEVVQVYVAPQAPRLPRPPKELKAFAKATLAPGETRRLALELEAGAFATWDLAAEGWVVDPGAYDIRVGRSAGDIALIATIRLS
ncbi:glycoside hydrolase family 3 C-terminal domain-containing protein [Phenylobacterium sp.]|uniref:beta-glucosidase H n=1 Tax=Phenylobacterium sp. TaxID=1871053 RepID=UPI0025D3FDFB|nr:glycoside hydrolase family 3 C-terminal domain-containing protein [Phenylobacterium sp.]